MKIPLVASDHVIYSNSFNIRTKQTLHILFDENGDHYDALTKRQQNADISKDTCKSSIVLPTGSSVLVQRIDGGY